MARTLQLLTLAPSSNTVQAPQLLVSQPTTVPTLPRRSRRCWTRSVRGSTSSWLTIPSTVMLMRGTRTPRVVVDRSLDRHRPRSPLKAGSFGHAVTLVGVRQEPDRLEIRPSAAQVGDRRPGRIRPHLELHPALVPALHRHPDLLGGRRRAV